MEQLIFVAAIVVFTIIDAMSRRRKAKQRKASPPLPEEWEDAAWEAQSERDPSTPSSETMLPRDFLEELAALASGRTAQPPARTTDRPTKAPKIPEVPEFAGSPIGSRGPDRLRPRSSAPTVHEVHLAHAGYGTDPSSRVASAQDGLDPLTVALSRDAATIHRQLQSHSAHELRRAIVLQDVLGPPAALRGERFQD